jgi:hypothetical protein
MRNFILTMCMVATVMLSQAQNTKGTFYVGTGDVANTAWTDWAVSPSVGYAFTDALLIGGSVSQVDADADMNLDFYARYFWNGMFVHAGMNGLNFDEMTLGMGKMFTLRDNVYVDPAIVYSAGDETINLTLGFGFKF